MTRPLLGRDNPEKYFDERAPHYEAVMRGWGYNLPEVAADQLDRLLADGGG